MDDEVLRNFVANGGSTKQKEVKIRLWESRYKDTYDHKCFRLTIGLCDYDYVFNRDFWPLDISVRRYWLAKEERPPGMRKPDSAAAASEEA